MLNAQLQHVMSPSSGLFVAAITTTGRPDSRVTRPSMQVRSWFNVDSACTRCHWHVRSSFQLSCTDEGKQTYMYRDIRKFKKKTTESTHVHAAHTQRALHETIVQKWSQNITGYKRFSWCRFTKTRLRFVWDYMRLPSTINPVQTKVSLADSVQRPGFNCPDG